MGCTEVPGKKELHLWLGLVRNGFCFYCCKNESWSCKLWHQLSISPQTKEFLLLFPANSEAGPLWIELVLPVLKLIHTTFLFVLPGQVVMPSCAHLYLARLLNTFKTAEWTSWKGCLETSIRIWRGLDAMALKSDLMSTDRSSEGMSAEWKINANASSDRPFTSASEELILLHRIFMISSLRALLSNTTRRPCSECATAPIVCIAINLRAGSLAVRKEKTFWRKMGYCWVTSAGLDCAR